MNSEDAKFKSVVIYCAILTDLKENNLKKIKNGVGAVFTGRVGTITSFIFYEA